MRLMRILYAERVDRQTDIIKWKIDFMFISYIHIDVMHCMPVVEMKWDTHVLSYVNFFYILLFSQALNLSSASTILFNCSNILGADLYINDIELEYIFMENAEAEYLFIEKPTHTYRVEFFVVWLVM